ncbi:MAG: L,D-transpeptidase family protein [Akkermansiaceae bacterium]
MKKLTSRLTSNRFALLILCVACLFVFVGSTVTGVARVIDTTNPSQLSEKDYANGAKRAADAAKRVVPRLEQEMYKTGVAVGNPVFIRVIKETRELEVWLLNRKTKRYQEFKRYRIMAMSGGLGPKVYEGDMQAVEGFYSFGRGALNPQSRFHLSFNLGYPNRYDRAHGRTGHSLMVHGNQVSAGCLAMTDYYVEEIYTLCAAALSNGQVAVPVHCFPFRMTDANMKAMKDSQWYGFWQNLKVGYDAFEKGKVPPRISVSGGRYVVK